MRVYILVMLMYLIFDDLCYFSYLFMWDCWMYLKDCVINDKKEFFFFGVVGIFKGFVLEL